MDLHGQKRDPHIDTLWTTEIKTSKNFLKTVLASMELNLGIGDPNGHSRQTWKKF